MFVFNLIADVWKHLVRREGQTQLISATVLTKVLSPKAHFHVFTSMTQ